MPTPSECAALYITFALAEMKRAHGRDNVRVIVDCPLIPCDAIMTEDAGGRLWIGETAWRDIVHEFTRIASLNPCATSTLDGVRIESWPYLREDAPELLELADHITTVSHNFYRCSFSLSAGAT